jgi:predicted metal-dependent hydrolase
MSTEQRVITVSGVQVQIIRKAIKNLHLGVYPPSGRVRVAAPLAMSDDAVRLAVIGKLAWIRRQRAKFDAQPRQSEREMTNGESHYFLGRRYRLRVVEHQGAGKVILPNSATIELHVRPELGANGRERVLQRWYRRQLRDLVPPLLAKWEAILGVYAASWGIKKMKTKWGACNAEAGRIWLNLELAKKPVQCLEYLIVHELIHLIERHHNDRFLSLMDRHMPNWRLCRHELNAAPLAHENWTY